METYIKIRAFRDCYDIRDVNTYTVEELIEQLSWYPKNAKVVLSFSDGYIFGGITDNEIYQCEVETKAEQEERERREQEEEDNTIWVCPNCEAEDTIFSSVKGGMQCLECGAHFKKPIIKIKR